MYQNRIRWPLMFDAENDIYFCICGTKVDSPGSCGKQECDLEYEDFQKKIDGFFELMETEGVWKGFQEFETFYEQLQIGILFELEDELMLLFLQALGQEKVLALIQSNNDAFRYRMLELLEPMIDKEVLEEFKNVQDLEREEIKEFLLYIINIILKSVQKVQ